MFGDRSGVHVAHTPTLMKTFSAIIQRVYIVINTSMYFGNQRLGPNCVKGTIRLTVVMICTQISAQTF